MPSLTFGTLAAIPQDMSRVTLPEAGLLASGGDCLQDGDVGAGSSGAICSMTMSVAWEGAARQRILEETARLHGEAL